MAPVRRIALDVLKPHEPELVEYAQQVSDLEGITMVNVSVIEIDREVQNVKLSVEGDDLDYSLLQATIQELGGTVHSVDEVVCGEYIIRESMTSPFAGAAWLR